MEYAISLRDGKDVLAVQADHEASRRRLLVCPECGEPVFFKKRWIPNETPFFSHYQELPTVKLLHKCSLRVEDATFRPASQVIRGISKGQLVDRFQREFCRELHLAFGRNSSRLGNFIRASQHELGKPARDELIRDVERGAPCNTILLRPLEDEDEADFRAGVADVCRFLRSSYGLWVSRFLYQTAYFLALVMHQRTLNDVIGRRLFRVNEQDVILVLDNARLLQSPDELAKKVLATRDQRNVAVFEIAPVLVSFLLLRWRRRGSLLPRLFAKAGPEFRLRNQARAPQELESRQAKRERTGISLDRAPSAPAKDPHRAPSVHQPSAGGLSPLPRSVPSQVAAAPGTDRSSLPSTSPYVRIVPRAYGVPQRLWYESAQVQQRPASLDDASSRSTARRPDVSYRQAGAQGSRVTGESLSPRARAMASLAELSASPSSTDGSPIASSGWVDGFVPDGAYIPASQVDGLKRVIRSCWPNGYQFGTSEWQFVKSMGLLVNLKTRRIYAGSQLHWHHGVVSIKRDGQVALEVPRSQVVSALLGSG